MALNFREVEVFRPYPDELPDELFAAAGLDEAARERCLGAEFVRIAKLAGDVVGAYALQPQSDSDYVLLNLAVAAPLRGQGLGRWLVGHAIGVSESKGARRVLVPCLAERRFFAQIGFVVDGDRQRYELVPE